MQRILLAGLIGLVFGAGIAIAGMINPAKVLNFFDIAGNWDPSLLIVMGSALTVTAIGYRFVMKRGEPLLDTQFHLPAKRTLDAPLIWGAAVFGIGWGIAGFCPGGAIPALGLGETSAIAFVAAIIVGMSLARILSSRFGNGRAAITE